MSNEYHIEISKATFLWQARVLGFNSMDLVPSKKFVRFTAQQASSAATKWCKRHNNRMNNQKQNFTYTP